VSLKGAIVFSSGRSADFDIWSLDLETAQLAQLTHGKDLNDCPRWSPDGSQVVFVSTQEDFISSLHVMNSDGSNRRRLTTDHYCQHPSWSPDGKSILFTGNVEDPSEIDICLCDVESGECKTLFTRDGIEAEPSFSPDGSKILFAGVNLDSKVPFAHRDTEIIEYDLNTGKEKVLCAHPARDYAPVYSPDGSRIAFVSHRNGRCEEEFAKELGRLKDTMQHGDMATIDKTIAKLQALDLDSDIYVMDSDGGNLKKLTNNSGADVGVRWSPCGKFLVYSTSPKGDPAKERISIIRADTGKAVSFSYDRAKLKAEIEANPDDFINHRFWLYLVPDFIERPFMKAYMGSHFWGRERFPDWTDF